MRKKSPVWRRYLRFRGADVRGDVDDELTFHIETVAAAYVADGDSPERALRRARDEFGDIDLARSQCYRIGERRRRRHQRGELFTALGQDIQYSIRALRASPGFTIGVVAMMALAIAANAAMFAVVDRMFVRAPAFLPDPASVHRLYENARVFNETNGLAKTTSYRRFEDVREWTRAFSDIAAYNERDLVVAEGTSSELRRVARVTGGFWRIFDVKPFLGVFPTDSNDAHEPASLVTVLAYDYWRTHFNADSAVLGRSITIATRSYRIIGVAPPGFVGLSDLIPAAFVPLEETPPDMFRYGSASTLGQYNSAWIELIARRKSGWSTRDAAADFTSALQRSVARQRGLAAIPPGQDSLLRTSVVRGVLAPVLAQQGPMRTDEARVALWLGGVAAVVLLIAALNVANLMLARTLRRQREIAVRVALGATIGRLMRLLMAEAGLLMAGGTVLGLGALWWFGEAARQALLPNVTLPRIGVDLRVVAFASLCSAIVAMIIALAPALHALRWNVAAAISDGGRAGSLRRSRMRAIILVTQAALSLTLCVTAGLFVRSLYNVRALPLGYDPRHVLTLTPVNGASESGAVMELTSPLAARARNLDEAADVAEAVALPFTMSMFRRISVPGVQGPEEMNILYNSVSPEYFHTVGTRILDGRSFSAADTVGAERVAIISASMASRFWPGREAIGQCFELPRTSPPECLRIVGVAEATRHWSYERDAMLDYYVPLAQSTSGSPSILVRTRVDAKTLAEGVRRRLQPTMPTGVVLKVAPLQNALDKAAAPWRVGATMLSIFAALALLVASLGVYATASYDLTEREHEIGIRMALGATSRDLVRATVLRGLGLAAVGITAGLIVSFAVGSIVATLLFHVSSRDPESFVVGAAAIIIAFVAASGAPALRAARADPSTILRSG